MSSYAAKLQVKMSTKGADKTINDIDGVSKSADQATTSSGKLSKAFKSIAEPAKAFAKGAAAVGVAVLAAGAAMTALVKSAANTGRELQNLSGVADTSVENFQRMAFAAKSVGIEQDKLADILKDTGDKIGDFLQSGGGAMTDFFENIAPKVGVTADQFKKLSAPDALQLYVSSLDKANLSQSEMTFYMEAIASDSAMLLPLLRNNGKEMGAMANRARELGIVLSAVDVRQLAEANKKFDEMGATFGFIKNKVAVELEPTLSSLMGYLFNVGGQGENTGEVIEGAFDGINGSIAKTLDGLWYMGKSWDALKEKMSEAKDEPFVRGLNLPSIQLATAFFKAYSSEVGNALGDGVKEGLDIVDEIPPGTKWLTALETQKTERINFFKQSQLEANLAELVAVDEFEQKKQIIALDYAQGTEDALMERLAREAQIQADYEDGLKLRSEQNSKAWNQSKRDRAAKDKAIDDKAAADAIANAQMVADQKATIMSSMSSVFQALMSSGSKKEFELGKKASIGMALINTYQGATKAYGQGGMWGFAAAGAVVAAGMAQVNAIKNTQFGGGGSASAPPTAPSLPSGVGGGGGSQQVSINITGGSFGAGAGDDVIDKLKDFFSRDGVLFDGASTQGQVIANG